MKKSNIKVNGHKGTWYVIGEQTFREKQVYLLEHETYGDEAACLIVDEDLNIIVKDVYNGFDDLLDNTEPVDYNFSTWRKENGYKSWNSYYNDELTEGTDEDTIKEQYQAVKDEFGEYCGDNCYNPVWDED